MKNFLRSLGIALALLVPTGAIAAGTGQLQTPCCDHCPCPCCD